MLSYFDGPTLTSDLGWMPSAPSIPSTWQAPPQVCMFFFLFWGGGEQREQTFPYAWKLMCDHLT